MERVLEAGLTFNINLPLTKCGARYSKLHFTVFNYRIITYRFRQTINGAMTILRKIEDGPQFTSVAVVLTFYLFILIRLLFKIQLKKTIYLKNMKLKCRE
jgi:hypothetical protein